MWFFGKKDKTPKVEAIEITDQNFEKLVANSEYPVLLDFWASWCGPCKVMVPIINELAREYKDQPIVIGKINTETNPALSQHFQVRSIPLFLAIHNKQIVFKHAGMIPKPNLAEVVDKLIEQHRNTPNEIVSHTPPTDE